MQGIRGRLNVYVNGKALTSGLGEAVLDRPLPTRSGFALNLSSWRQTDRGGPRRGGSPRLGELVSKSVGRPHWSGKAHPYSRMLRAPHG
jgi:hypothetical protein